MTTHAPNAPKKFTGKPIALVISVVAIVWCLVVGAVAAFVPWRYWWDLPKVEILACKIDEKPHDNARPLGIAIADFKITNWSWVDREYAVKLVAKSFDGTVVGAMDVGYVVKVPARSSVDSHQHWITLTKSGAMSCDVGEAIARD